MAALITMREAAKYLFDDGNTEAGYRRAIAFIKKNKIKTTSIGRSLFVTHKSLNDALGISPGDERRQ